MTVYRDHTVGVVVPAYDEENFVGEVVETMPDFVDRIYPVDDASTDRTWAEIRAAARRVNAESEFSPESEAGSAVPDGAGVLRPPESEERESGSESPTDRSTEAAESADQRRVVPLRHEENRGVGAAIKTGYREAREDGMDAVAVMAGDAQMDPDQLPRLLDPVVSGRAAYSKGNRLAMDEYREEMSRWRQFGNDLLTVLTRISSGYWSMSDPQNGYTAVAGEALDELDLDAIFDDYGFANAMLVHLNVADARIADVPMPAKYGDEKSGIRYSTFVPQLSALLAKGFVWRLAEKHVRREFHPLALLYALGAVGTLMGLLGTVRGRLPDGERDDNDEEPETDIRYDDDDESDSYGDERAYRSGRVARDGTMERRGRTGRDAQAEHGGQTERDAQESQGGRPRGWWPMTALAGLVATGLAMGLDARHGEDLHVTADEDEETDFESGASTSEGKA